MNNYHVMFDGRMIGRRMHGIARHLINLINGLNVIAPQNKYTVIINNEEAFEYFGDKVDIVWAKTRFLSPLESIEIPRIISKIKPDIFHNPSSSPVVPNRKIPYVVTIHDLIHLKERENYLKYLYYKTMTKRTCRLSARTLTVSEYSKREISKILSIKEDHIDVIYNGIQDKFFKPITQSKLEDVKRRYRLPDDYILYIGSSDIHRNLKGMIDAYLRSGVKEPLVLALYWDQIKHNFKSPVKPASILCIGNILDNDIHYVYRGAKLFLFPSFVEGFGLSVVEAMASEVPVITSNVSSLSEISRACAIEVDPKDTGAISDAIKLGLSDNVLRERNIALGKERAKEFTINRMAERVVDIYESILKNKRG